MRALEIPGGLPAETRIIRVLEKGDNGSGQMGEMRVKIIRSREEDILPPCPAMRPLPGEESPLRIRENSEKNWVWRPGFSLYLDLACGGFVGR